MITDHARQKLIPSLADVLAALKKVPPAHTVSPRRLELPVYAESRSNTVRMPGDTFSKILPTPVIALQAVRCKEDDREFDTWSVVEMPEFHL